MNEKKLFDTGEFVVTTERFIHGSQSIHLDEIELAVPFVDRNWVGILVSGGIGLAIMGSGSFPALALGLLVLFGGPAFFHYTTTGQVMLSMKDDETVTFGVRSIATINDLARFTNRAIADRRHSQADALRREVDSLPLAE